MRKKLYRSKSNKIISGVCSGLAEYFRIDAKIVRVIWVILFFIGSRFLMLFIYIAAALLIPEESGSDGKYNNNYDNIYYTVHDDE